MEIIIHYKEKKKYKKSKYKMYYLSCIEQNLKSLPI